MTELTYRSAVSPDDLRVGECTIRQAAGLGSDGRTWWNLWCCVQRADVPTEPLLFRVFVIPRGEHGPGPSPNQLAWGLTDLGNGRWQVHPSIDHGALWHQTPVLVGVPSGEPWQ